MIGFSHIVTDCITEEEMDTIYEHFDDNDTIMSAKLNYALRWHLKQIGLVVKLAPGSSVSKKGRIVCFTNDFCTTIIGTIIHRCDYEGEHPDCIAMDLIGNRNFKKMNIWFKGQPFGYNSEDYNAFAF